MKRKKILSTLIKNYVIFTTLVILICIATAIFISIQMTVTMKEELFPKITADLLVQENYQEIDSADIELLDGWVEILDENNNVIFTKGDKKTSNISYSASDLADILGYQKTQQYLYTSSSFVTPQGRQYILLAALPVGRVDYRLNLNQGPFDIYHIFIRNIVLGLIFFAILFSLNIYLYSKWTAKKISEPLEKITEVINEMSLGDIQARMEFKAEYEFLQIKEAFNLMANRLEDSEKAKQKLEDSRKRMFVDISHDLKTPITTINGYAKALSEGMIADEGEKQKYLQTIYNKSNRVTKLIDNLFELSKLENLTPKLNKSKENLVEFIRAIAAEYYQQIEEKGMELEFLSEKEKLQLDFDKKELGRVVANILNNAIEYNPPGTNIRIEVFEKDNSVIIEIGDNGVGIHNDLKERVFTPFVRGDSTRHTSGGTGLGLAISKKIIEGHGGTLELLTNIGKYKTLFRIKLFI